MVPPATFRHQTLGSDLLVVLHRLGRSPDLVLVSPNHTSERGVEGSAALVVEILSPNDESRDKLPFYARMGVSEVWLLHPTTRTFEVFALCECALVVR